LPRRRERTGGSWRSAAAWGCTQPPCGGWIRRYQTKSGSSAPFTHNTDQLALIIHLPEKFAKPVFCLREI
ncbi:hypothetical protein ICNMLN_ICNMLN_17915, partial [Dysosmobacter welbionis]